MTYQCRVAKSFGESGIVTFEVNSQQEVELVKSFMLRIAPELSRHALRSDTTPDQNAEQALYWAMHLAAKFAHFSNEALKALEEENAIAGSQQDPPHQTAGVQQAAPGVSSR